MWAFLCAGPYPTNLNFEPYRPVNPRKSWSVRKNSSGSAVLNCLRNHAGRDVTLRQLAAETGYSRSRISGWLCANGIKSGGRYYMEQGIITRRGKGVYRYEEPSLAGAGRPGLYHSPPRVPTSIKLAG